MKLLLGIIIEKFDDHMDWGRYSQAQAIVDALNKVFIRKLARKLQEKLDYELNLRTVLKINKFD